MTADDRPSGERFSLSRWSRRKHEAARAPRREDAAAATAAPVDAPAAMPAPAAAVAPPAEPLPPVESLTIDSDFAPFFQPKVDDSTKRAALKKLFTDPHFNAMDGLDVYIDDYTASAPLPSGMLDKLARVYDAVLGDDTPPATAAPGDMTAVATAAEPARVTDAQVEPPGESLPAGEAAAALRASAPLAPALSPQAERGSTKDAPT